MSELERTIHRAAGETPADAAWRIGSWIVEKGGAPQVPIQAPAMRSRVRRDGQMPSQRLARSSNASWPRPPIGSIGDITSPTRREDGGGGRCGVGSPLASDGCMMGRSKPCGVHKDETARYNPSPYHKSAPSGSPRHDKTVCDGPASTGRDGRELLTSGFRRGMVSSQERRGWPQNVWAVDEDGVAYEAQLGNAELGEYHGYPMKMDDDFARVVRRAWEERSP